MAEVWAGEDLAQYQNRYSERGEGTQLLDVSPTLPFATRFFFPRIQLLE